MCGSLVSEFFRRTCVPDSRVEFGTVRELNLLKTLLVVDVKCVLYLVSDRYIGNRGSLSDVPAFALLVTPFLSVIFFRRYPIGVPKNSSLKNDFEGFSWKRS